MKPLTPCLGYCRNSLTTAYSSGVFAAALTISCGAWLATQLESWQFGCTTLQQDGQPQRVSTATSLRLSIAPKLYEFSSSLLGGRSLMSISTNRIEAHRGLQPAAH